ncbi:MAG TPA: hypothetical protein VIO37_01355 [Candidatus Dormibacteraeota bacterium]
MEDKPTPGGIRTPSEVDVARMVRAEVETWTPRRGPDWTDILIRMAGTGPSPWVVYTTASAALVVILIAAYLIGSALQLGALAPPPAQVHLH